MSFQQIIAFYSFWITALTLHYSLLYLAHLVSDIGSIKVRLRSAHLINQIKLEHVWLVRFSTQTWTIHSSVRLGLFISSRKRFHLKSFFVWGYSLIFSFQMYVVFKLFWKGERICTFFFDIDYDLACLVGEKLLYGAKVYRAQSRVSKSILDVPDHKKIYIYIFAGRV